MVSSRIINHTSEKMDVNQSGESVGVPQLECLLKIAHAR